MLALQPAAAIEQNSEPARRKLFIPGQYDGQATPCLPMRKIVPSHADWAILMRIKPKRTPTPLAQTMGPICKGAYLATDDRDKKISSHTTHSAAETPLACSAATGSNFHIKHNRAAV
jgi:hypothetical protein